MSLFYEVYSKKKKSIFDISARLILRCSSFTENAAGNTELLRFTEIFSFVLKHVKMLTAVAFMNIR